MYIMVTTEYIIVGAGIAGLSLGIGLHRRGKEFVILERSQLVDGIGAGLGITSNAITAFEHIGMADKVKAVANPLDTLRIVDRKGKLLVNGDPGLIAGYDLTNYALHRSDLHQCLFRELPAERVHTRKQCAGIEERDGWYLLTCEDGSVFRGRYLVGADGLHSFVRRYIFPDSVVRYAGYTCWRAVIDLKEHFPYTSEETWGADGRFGITPLVNRQVYWYACINSAKPRDPYYTAFTIDDLRHHFREYHPAVVNALALTGNHRLIQNDIADMKPLPVYHKGHTVLLGDAAHATTPNMGQGACMGVEDAVVLLQELDRASSVAEAMAGFSRRRTERCRFIVATSQKMGRIAQLDHRFLVPVRNFLVRHLPAAIQRRQLAKVLDVSGVL